MSLEASVDVLAAHIAAALARIDGLERRLSLLEGAHPTSDFAKPMDMPIAVKRDRERAEMGLRELPGARARRLASLHEEVVG